MELMGNIEVEEMNSVLLNFCCVSLIPVKLAQTGLAQKKRAASRSMSFI
jgi:hypothetical protein